MDEMKVTLPLSDYSKLVAYAAKVEAVEWLVNRSDYITTDSICAVLGIERKERDKNVD